jgi:selenocysteine lyase/cysteine desulfurase
VDDNQKRLVETIRHSIIGGEHAIDGPFGHRRITYADYTASGRSLTFIEDYIRKQVLPMYANTHTETSGTGLQTTRYREDARDIIRNAVGAGPDDVVLFCGSGATGAIDKLIDCLNIRLPKNLDKQYGLSKMIPPEERPVVFIGPYEHHSNELPWRESLADVIVIAEGPDGKLDLVQLEAELKKYQSRPMLIGSFSAASNVTGIGSNTRATSALLHKYNAYSFWDFAAAGPYVQIEMNMKDDEPGGELIYKDAIFISTHKFIGGPGTPGILVAKKHLFTNEIPAVVGGGTVSFVSHNDHRYVKDVERREEGGTPDIVGSIRAGLVFQLKDAVGANNIRSLEHGFIRRAIDRWGKNPNIRVLGNQDAWRLSIVSFQVNHGSGVLHYNYIVALLNDLFGIHARGGCSCAGPYGHRLLGIDPRTSEAHDAQIAKGCFGVRPGWVRVNFNYFISDTVLEYILDAVDLVATHGWRLLPQYNFCPTSGMWRHKLWRPEVAASLEGINYRCGKMEFRQRHITEPEFALASYLEEGRQIMAAAQDEQDAPPARELDAEFEKLRWFPLPEEISKQLIRLDAPAGK